MHTRVPAILCQQKWTFIQQIKVYKRFCICQNINLFGKRMLSPVQTSAHTSFSCMILWYLSHFSVPTPPKETKPRPNRNHPAIFRAWAVTYFQSPSQDVLNTGHASSVQEVIHWCIKVFQTCGRRRGRNNCVELTGDIEPKCATPLSAVSAQGPCDADF